MRYVYAFQRQLASFATLVLSSALAVALGFSFMQTAQATPVRTVSERTGAVAIVFSADHGWRRVSTAPTLLHVEHLLHLAHVSHLRHLAYLAQMSAQAKLTTSTEDSDTGASNAVTRTAPVASSDDDSSSNTTTHSTPPSSLTGSDSGGSYTVGSAFQACVIRAESGGNPNIWNASGHWGLYQFSASTWAMHGGDPALFGHASAAYQTQIFWNTYNADGTSDWAPYDGC